MALIEQYGNLTALSLVRFNGEHIDVSNILNSISIIETIDGPTYGELILRDEQQNLRAELPIIGDEYLYIAFRSDENAPEIQKTFKINSASETEINRGKFLRLDLISPIQYINSNIRISKSYVETESEIVKQICYEALGDTDGMVGAELSKYSKTIIIPNLSPLAAIKFLLRTAISTNGYTDYVFFENRFGYMFVTLSSLISEDPIAAINFNTADSNKMLGNRWRALGYSIVKCGDALQAQRKGALKNNLCTYNPIKKKIEHHTLDYHSEWNNYNNSGAVSGKNPIHSSDNVSISNGAFNMFPKIPESPYNKVDEYMMQREQKMYNWNQHILNVTLGSNTFIVLGAPISLNLKSTSNTTPSGDAKEVLYDRQYAGKWLIWSVTHTITPSDKPGKIAHTTNLELRKESFYDMSKG